MLHRILARMAAAAPKRDDSRAPHRLAHSLLESAEPGQQAAVLRRLVVLTAPLDGGRDRGPYIRFLRVLGDARTPLPFDTLRRGGGEGRDGAGERGRIRIADKVRGSALGNFAAFLSAKWRANDWMWGRLDAVASLVPLLVDPVRLRQHNADLGAQELGDALESMVCRPTRAELGELDEEAAERWHGFLAERWAAHADDIRAELSALFERPEDEHPLTETRTLVTERLQWTIAAEEVPFVTSVASGADPEAPDVAPARDPKRLSQQVRRYDVGRGRIDELDERRRASMATRFALITHRAVLPDRSSLPKILARVGMAALKPVLMTLAFALAAPARAALVAFLTAVGLACTSWESAGSPGQWATLFGVPGVSLGVASCAAAAAAVIAALWLGWQVSGLFGSGGPVVRLFPALVASGVLLAGGGWLWATGWRLGPLGLAVLAVLTTWLAMFACRSSGRVAATVLTAVVFGSTMWAGVLLGWSVAGWMAVAVAAVAYAHMLLFGTVDVLPPRPRVERATEEPGTLRETETLGDDLRERARSSLEETGQSAGFGPARGEQPRG